MPAGIVIRPLGGVAEFRAAENLQARVWGFEPLDVVPFHQLLTAAKFGGCCLGAFAQGATGGMPELVGVSYGFCGFGAARRPLLCSHLLAVLPDFRRRGVGLALKLAQAEAALATGIDLITWTFDPLETGNGMLNIARLGAIARVYRANLYGEMQDGLNRGLPTDRLVVEWPLRSDRVRRCRAGEPPATGEPASERRWLEVPRNFQAIKAERPREAMRWRLAVREQLMAAFADGFVLADCIDWPGDAERPEGRYYVLSRDDALLSDIGPCAIPRGDEDAG